MEDGEKLKLPTDDELKKQFFEAMEQIVKFRVEITDFLNGNEAVELIKDFCCRELEDKMIAIKRDTLKSKFISLEYGDIILTRYLTIRMYCIIMKLLSEPIEMKMKKKAKK